MANAAKYALKRMPQNSTAPGRRPLGYRPKKEVGQAQADSEATRGRAGVVDRPGMAYFAAP